MSRVVCSFVSNSFLNKLLLEKTFKDNSVGMLELSAAITTYQTYHRELTNEELLDKNIQQAILGIIELSRENAKEEARIKEQYEDELLTILDNAPRDEQGRLLAPNGKPSNLNERQYAQVRTKAFKDWFGDWTKVAYSSKFRESRDIPNSITSATYQGVYVSEVVFDPDMAPDGGTRIIRLNNEYIGEIPVLEYKDKIKMSGSIGAATEIEEEYRGKGYGKKAHLALANIAKSEGKTLYSDSSNSDAEDALWKSLVKDGIAEVISESPKVGHWNHTTYRIINDKLPQADDIDPGDRDVSKVLDENGEPLVVYHGTHTKFNTFDSKSFHFFGTIYTAKEYADGDYVLPVFINARNLRAMHPNSYEIGDSYDILSKKINNNIDGLVELAGDGYGPSDDEALEKADKGVLEVYREKDFFTLVDKLQESPSKNDKNFIESEYSRRATDYINSHGIGYGRFILSELAVKNSNQIKSAEYNIGSFSRTNDRIDRFTEQLTHTIDYLESSEKTINTKFSGSNLQEVFNEFRSVLDKIIKTHLELYHYDLGQEETSFDKLLENLKDPNAYFQYIQKLSNSIINKLQSLGKTIQIIPNNGSVMSIDSSSNTIKLYYNPNRLLRDFSKFDYILAHELVHSVTSNAINNTVDNTATKEEELFSNEIWDIIADLYNNKNFHWNFGFNLNDKEGRASHIKEFIANVMTNPNLQSKLALIKTGNEKKSLWSKFISAIKKLLNKYLGVDTRDSYLEKLMNTVSSYIENLTTNIGRYNNNLVDRFTEGEKKVNSSVTKIISGGQTGVDTLGLQIAKKLGIETGGTAPKGFLREEGVDNEDIKSYGLVEVTDELQSEYTAKTGKSDPWTARTELNVRNSDGTVYFGNAKTDAGYRATSRSAKEYDKPFLYNPDALTLRKWIEDNNIKTLNIAGNRGSKLLKEDIKKISDIIEQALTVSVLEDTKEDKKAKKTKEDKAAKEARKHELERKKKVINEQLESLKTERPIDLADLIDKSEFTNILYNAIPDIVERRALVSTFNIMFSTALDTKFKAYKEKLNSTPDESLSDEELLLKEALNKGTEEELKIVLLNMAKIGNDALPKAIINQMWNLVLVISTAVDKLGNVNESKLEQLAKSLLFDNGKFKRNNIFGEEFYQKCKLELENSRRPLDRRALANKTIKELATSFNKISDINVFLAIIDKASAELEYNENIKLTTNLNGTDRTAVDDLNIDEEGSADNRSGLNLVKYKMLLPSKIMSVRIKKLLGSVYKMKDGKYEFNTLGFRVKINPHIAYYTLIGRFAKMNRPEDFYDIIDSTILVYPWFEEIVKKLDENEDLRNEFYSAFRNVFVPSKLINADGTITNLNQDTTAETILDLVTNAYESGDVLGTNSIYNADSGCWTENVSKTARLFKDKAPLGSAVLILSEYKKLPKLTERNKEKIILGVIDTIKMLRGIHPSHPDISLEALLNNLGIDTIDMDLGVLLPNVDVEGYSELEGISLEEAIQLVFTDALADKLVKILTSAHTIVNNKLGRGFTKGMHLTRNFRKAYLVIGNNLPIASKRYTEVSFNFNNKQRTSYAAPDLISELVGILSNTKDDKSIEVAKQYIEDNFKKFDYFYDSTSKKWRHSWLELLYEAVTNKDKKSLEIMSHFAYLNILGINGGLGDNTIGKVEKEVFTEGIIKAFFTTTRDAYGNEYGNYRNTLFSDTDALVLFTFKKYTGDNLEEQILDKLVDVFEAEYDRILFYKSRTNHNNDITFYSDDKGNSKKFFFFPHLNLRINEIIRELSSIESHGDLYQEDRRELIKSYILPYLQDKFEQFYNLYGTDSLFRKIKDLKNNTVEKADQELVLQQALLQEIENEKNEENSQDKEDATDKEEEDELFDQEKENAKELAKELAKRKLFQEFYYNDYLAHIELTRMLIGDPSLFKNMDDAIKRAKLVYASGKKGYFLDENGNRMKERAMYLEDRDLMSPTWKQLDSLLEQSSDFTKMDKALIRGAIAKITGDYKSITTTDGQSLRTLKSLRTILKSMGGKWTEDMESSYNRLLDGTFTGADFATFWNSVKPFLTSHELRYAENDLGKVRAEKVVTLHKNSEYVISALYTVLNTKLNSSPLLRGLQKFMEKNDIDVVHFKSVVKEGFNNPFDLTYDKEAFEEFKKHPNRNGVTFNTDSWKDFIKDALDKLLKGLISQNLYNELITELNFEGKSSKVEDRVFNALTSQLLNSRGRVNKDMFHEFDLNDYIIMQPTDDHLMDEVAVFGSQLRNILPADISPNTTIKVYINGEEVTLTGKEVVDYYNALITDLLLDSFAKVDRLFRNPVALKGYIDQLIKNNPKYGQDVIDALLLTKDKKAFIMPFNSPNLLNKIEEIILSAFKNAIQRLKITGGSAVLVSNFALSNDLLIKYKNNDPKQGVEYIPAYMPASMMSVYRDYLIEKTDKSGNTYYTVDFKTFERNADKDLLNIIGYRIPTEAKYSIMPIRIVGFMPVTLGTTIMLPSDIITMSGTDFDIDKLFLMIKKAEVAIAGKDMIEAARKYIGSGIKDEKPIVKALLYKDYLTLLDIDVLTRLSGKFNEFYLEKGKEYLYKPINRKLKVMRGSYDSTQSLLDASKLSDIKSPLRRKYIRDNMLIDVAWGILTSPEVSAQSAMPGQFETLKSAAIRARILNDETARREFMKRHKGENIIQALYEEDDKALEEFFNKYGQLRDFADILDYADTHDNLMQGNDLIGRSAVNSSNHYKLLFIGARIRDEISEKLLFKGHKLSQISAVYSPIDGHRITLSQAEVQAAAPDNGKFPVLGYLNVNNDTINRFDLFIKLGIPLMDAAMLNVVEPHLDFVFKLTGMTPKDIRLKEAGLFDGDIYKAIDLLYRAMNANPEELSELDRQDLVNFVSWYYILDDMSKELSNISSVSRCDSTNGALPVSVAEAIQLKLRAEKFIETTKSDASYFTGLNDLVDTELDAFDGDVRREILQSKIPRLQAAYTLGILGGLRMASRYLPLLDTNVLAALRELGKYTKSSFIYTKDLSTIKTFYKELNTFIFTLNSIFSGNDKYSTIDKRNYYIHDFPIKFKEFLSLNANQSIRRYSIIRNLLNSPKLGIVYANIGKNSSLIRQYFSEELDALGFSDRAEVRDFALDLLMYSFYNNGLNYTHNSFGVLFSTAFLSSVPRFIDSLRGSTSVVTLNREYLSKFINQFILNNPSIIPLASDKDYNLNLDKTLTIHRPTEIGKGPNSVMYIGSKGIPQPLPFIKVRFIKDGKRIINIYAHQEGDTYVLVNYNTTGNAVSYAKTPYYNANSNLGEFEQELGNLKSRGRATISDKSLRKLNAKNNKVNNINNQDMDNNTIGNTVDTADLYDGWNTSSTAQDFDVNTMSAPNDISEYEQNNVSVDTSDDVEYNPTLRELDAINKSESSDEPSSLGNINEEAEPDNNPDDKMCINK